MKSPLLAAALLAALSSAAMAQSGPAYLYAGSHAGGPADALIPDGAPLPVVAPVTGPAYRYAGSHAGGPADALIPNGPRVLVHGRHGADPAYRYSGSHAGGPANDLIAD